MSNFTFEEKVRRNATMVRAFVHGDEYRELAEAYLALRQDLDATLDKQQTDSTILWLEKAAVVAEGSCQCGSLHHSIWCAADLAAEKIRALKNVCPVCPPVCITPATTDDQARHVPKKPTE